MSGYYCTNFPSWYYFLAAICALILSISIILSVGIKGLYITEGGGIGLFIMFYGGSLKILEWSGVISTIK